MHHRGSRSYAVTVERERTHPEDAVRPYVVDDYRTQQAAQRNCRARLTPQRDSRHGRDALRGSERYSP